MSSQPMFRSCGWSGAETKLIYAGCIVLFLNTTSLAEYEPVKY